MFWRRRPTWRSTLDALQERLAREFIWALENRPLSFRIGDSLHTLRDKDTDCEWWICGSGPENFGVWLMDNRMSSDGKYANRSFEGILRLGRYARVAWDAFEKWRMACATENLPDGADHYLKAINKMAEARKGLTGESE